MRKEKYQQLCSQESSWWVLTQVEQVSGRVCHWQGLSHPGNIPWARAAHRALEMVTRFCLDTEIRKDPGLGSLCMWEWQERSIEQKLPAHRGQRNTRFGVRPCLCFSFHRCFHLAVGNVPGSLVKPRGSYLKACYFSSKPGTFGVEKVLSVADKQGD